MDSEIDPEVLADIELRNSTERDHTRCKEPPTWTRPVIADHWPCRTCGGPVGVTGEAIEHAAVFSRELARRGEDPIDTDAVMFCEPCRAGHRATAAVRRQREMAAMTALIGQLAASRTPANETALISQLRNWGHPDVDGLLEAITMQRTRRKPKGEM